MDHSRKKYQVWTCSSMPQWVASGALVLLLAGCATVGYEEKPLARTQQPGVYHKVKKGETVWRIAKTYLVDMNDVVQANALPDRSDIEEGQLLFIPGAEQTRNSAPSEDDSHQDEFIWPVRGRVIHYFGDRKQGYFYKGIGIQAREGETVRAARQGKVVFADYLAGYDYTVMLDHRDGYISVYSLNSKVLVNLGDTISKGDPLAYIGKRGNNSFLYFEIRRNAVAENPVYFLPKI